MTIRRMDRVGVVVDDLEAAVAFFVELGMERGGGGSVDGAWVDGVVGLENVRSDFAFVRTPDGHGQLELLQFRSPPADTRERNAPANALGIRHLTFAVDDIEDVLTRLRPHGAELVGRVEQFENTFKLCYVRGPAGIIVELAEEIG